MAPIETYRITIAALISRVTHEVYLLPENRRQDDHVLKNKTNPSVIDLVVFKNTSLSFSLQCTCIDANNILCN